MRCRLTNCQTEAIATGHYCASHAPFQKPTVIDRIIAAGHRAIQPFSVNDIVAALGDCKATSVRSEFRLAMSQGRFIPARTNVNGRAMMWYKPDAAPAPPPVQPIYVTPAPLGFITAKEAKALLGLMDRGDLGLPSDEAVILWSKIKGLTGEEDNG